MATSTMIDEKVTNFSNSIYLPSYSLNAPPTTWSHIIVNAKRPRAGKISKSPKELNDKLAFIYQTNNGYVIARIAKIRIEHLIKLIIPSDNLG